MYNSRIMKKIFSKFLVSALIAFSFVSFESCKKTTETNSKELVVYAYDSFVGEWGPGPELTKKFEEKTGIKLNLVDCGDAVQVLSRAILEKDSVQADVIIGLDNNNSKTAIDANIIEEYKTSNVSFISKDLFAALQNENQFYVTPYDYSHFAMIFDTKANVQAPKSLEDLTNPIYKNKIILMDPRTSTPGLGFVAWTVSTFGDKVLDYWKALKPNILTMAPGWSSGYGLFTKGEAPIVISYTTSPAYHVEYDKEDRFQAQIFEQGHSWQVEGAAILKNAKNKEGAKAFIDFLTSEEAQNVLPLTQWMYPANDKVKLPECYKKAAPIPSKTLIANSSDVQKTVEQVMKILSE